MAEVVCPSGLAGVVRGLAGKEIKVLSDKKLLRTGLLVDRVMELCWESTTAAGPYEVPEGKGSPDWQKVLQGDRFVAAVAVHAATFGKDFEFDFQCPRPLCNKRGTWVIDLLTNLEMKPYTPEALKTFMGDGRFQGVLPDGKRFWYRLPVGEDERLAAKLGSAQAAENLIPLVCNRIFEIEDVKSPRAYFEDGSMNLVFEAIAEMSLQDGGIDSQFEIECPACGEEMATEIPFGKLLSPDMKAMKAARTSPASS